MRCDGWDECNKVLHSLQLTGNDAALQAMAVLVQLPCAPLAKDRIADGVVNVQHIVFGESKLTVAQIAGAIEADANVQRIAGFVFDFDLIEFCGRWRIVEVIQLVRMQSDRSIGNQ